MSESAGVVIRVGDQRRFVPAERALQLVPRPVVTRVPGTAIGMTLYSGRVIPVVEVGPDRNVMLVCDVDGETLGLTGASVIEVGFFDASADGVSLGGEHVPPLDVAGELAQAEARLLSGPEERS